MLWAVSQFWGALGHTLCAVRFTGDCVLAMAAPRQAPAASADSTACIMYTARADHAPPSQPALVVRVAGRAVPPHPRQQHQADTVRRVLQLERRARNLHAVAPAP